MNVLNGGLPRPAPVTGQDNADTVAKIYDNEARPAIAEVPETIPSLGHLPELERRAPIRTA